MDDTKAMDLEGELIFGALRREGQWKLIAMIMMVVALLGVGLAAAVVVWHKPPAPVLVPYDPVTGVAYPNATVQAVTLSEQDAVIEAAAYRYVIDRETYNQIDNDVRIGRALSQSEGQALQSLRRLWAAGHENYPPTRYGANAVIDVDVLSITRITNDRVNVRLRKRLRSPDGQTDGAFTVVMAYRFNPDTEKALEEVWKNPFGFTVTDYSISSDRRNP